MSNEPQEHVHCQLRMCCSQGDIHSDEYQFAHRIFSGKYNFIEELHGTSR
jgi:hypothetical protein